MFRPVVKIMKNLIIGIIVSYAIAEIYKSQATGDEKSRWENFVKTHHGEAGAVMAVVGLVAKSPALTGAGIGLVLHDRDDLHKWFR